MKKLRINLLMLALTVATVLLPEAASASGTFSLGDKLCGVYNCILNNSMLLVIATMAIFFLGIGAFFGKVNWGLVIIIALGITVIVGAGQIATLFVDTASASTGTCTIGATCAW